MPALSLSSVDKNARIVITPLHSVRPFSEWGEGDCRSCQSYSWETIFIIRSYGFKSRVIKRALSLNARNVRLNICNFIAIQNYFYYIYTVSSSWWCSGLWRRAVLLVVTNVSADPIASSLGWKMSPNRLYPEDHNPYFYLSENAKSYGNSSFKNVHLTI